MAGKAPSRWRSIPFVPQTAEKDCGAACLAMVLGYFGRAVRLDELRAALVGQRDGTDALSILEMGRAFHLNGRGVKVPSVADLRLVGRGAVLHWRFSHFVVLDRLTRRGAVILDPAMGRRHVSREELGRAFTGVALLFVPAESFRPDSRRRTAAVARHGIFRYVQAILSEWPALAKTLALSILLQAFALSLPLVTGLVVDRLVPTASRSLFTVLSAGAAAVAVFHFLASLVRSRLILELNVQLDERTTLSFLRHLVDLPYPFFQERSAGDLMMRLNSNTKIREILASGGISVVLDSLFIGIYLIILLVGSWRIGLLVLGLGALRVGLFLVARHRHRDLMAEALEVEARSRSYQVQLLAGIETLKASGAERTAVDHWAGLFVRELNVALAQGRLATLVQSILDALGVVSPIVVLLYGSHLVLSGALSLGALLALSSLAMGFLFPLSTLVPTAFQLQLLGSYVARINDVLDTPRELGEGARRRLPELSGRISLDGVCFAYGPKAPLAVRDISLEIEPGRMVALVGPSGAGKSTLAHLLVGLYRPLAGRIAYDGVDLGELDLRWLRRQVGIVSQQPYLFGTTIRDNIALSDPSLTLEQVIAAARLAHIHDDVDAMPLGYDTVLADGGLSLSGGQRQRIALARALVHRPPILLLDEATSAVDVETESAIERELRALDSTRIVIAHRLSTVLHADRILVLVDGQLTEQGRHDELLRQGGWYAQMVGTLTEREAG